MKVSLVTPRKEVYDVLDIKEVTWGQEGSENAERALVSHIYKFYVLHSGPVKDLAYDHAGQMTHVIFRKWKLHIFPI